MASSALALSSTTQPHSPVPPKIFSTSRHQVVCSHGSAIRVATVEQALPLRAAAQRMQTDETAWRAAIAVHPACSGTGDDALAVLDPVARQMRHSASPSHAIGVLSVAGGLVSVAWPLGNHKDDAGVDHEEREVTRDWLRLRYMVDAPCSAIDSLAGVG